MSATKFISNAFQSTISSVGSEVITVGGHKVEAVLGETTETEDLVLGGEGDHRILSVMFPTAALPHVPLKGQTVSVGNEDWQINQVDRHPDTTTRLSLNSPSRRQ